MCTEHVSLYLHTKENLKIYVPASKKVVELLKLSLDFWDKYQKALYSSVVYNNLKIELALSKNSVELSKLRWNRWDELEIVKATRHRWTRRMQTLKHIKPTNWLYAGVIYVNCNYNEFGKS